MTFRAIRTLGLRYIFIMSLSVVAAAVSALAAPPDSTLFTTYNVSATSVSLTVCGSLPGSSGCYGSAALGPFNKVGGVIEGLQSINLSTNTVTRIIYVLDIATGSSSNGVTLFAYKKTDAISSSFDTVTVALIKAVNLPIMGGASAIASMAANAKFLFIGTNQSPSAIVMRKSNFSFTGAGGFSPPINVAGITTDKYGYVTVTWGSFKGGESGFYVFGPDGGLVEDGGGSPVMLSTDQAVLPSTLP